MKHFAIAFLALGFACASASAQTEVPSGSGHGIGFLPQNIPAPVGPPISDKDLKQRQASEKFGGFAPEGSVPKGWGLEENSEFIAFEGSVTILPKGAIIHVPERFQKCIVKKPEGNLILWNEFIARFRGLVQNFDVTIEEASGETPVKPERLEAAKKTGLILVGTYNRNPITVNRSLAPQQVNAR